jgi:hypothetical protein
MKKEDLEKEGYYNLREIEGRGFCGLMKFIFTTGLVIGMNEIGYYGRYCYSSESEALEALTQWDGENDPPGNWIKYKGFGGDRSNPNYDKGCETCSSEQSIDFLIKAIKG